MSRKSWKGVIRPAYSAQKDTKSSLLRWADPHVRKSAAFAPSFPLKFFLFCLL